MLSWFFSRLTHYQDESFIAGQQQSVVRPAKPVKRCKVKDVVSELLILILLPVEIVHGSDTCSEHVLFVIGIMCTHPMGLLE